MRTKILAFIILIIVVIAVSAQERRPMTIDDLFAFKRVGGPVVSPDGEWIAFNVTEIDVEANTSSTVLPRPAWERTATTMSLP